MYINSSYDVTNTPPTNQTLTAVMQSLGPADCYQRNAIYKNGGRVCAQKMCACLTGSDTPFLCPGSKQWNDIKRFCGPIPKGCFYYQGNYWCQQSNQL